MPSPSTAPALYVDMDGALCATDTLWESLMELIRQRPLDLFRVPFWIMRGKAVFKREIAERVLPDVASLPLRPEVLDLLNARRAAGQRLVLATGAHRRIAEAMSARVGLFDAVLASDGQTNLTSVNKLAAIQADSKGAAFDYLGDSRADLPIFQACRQGYVVGPKESVWRSASSNRPADAPLQRLRPAAGGLKSVIRALRPHQWAKNALVGVPLVVSHQIGNMEAVWLTGLAIAAFSVIASAVYILNDLLDLPSDRVHPTKHKRPFASGAVSIPVGLAMTAVLFGGGLVLSFAAVNPRFGGMIALYLLITTLYSTFLKRKLVLDVFVLAGLYTIRILAGAVAINVQPSEWLLAFSMFIFTSLAMLKRYTELKAWSKLNEKWPAGRRYTLSDMELFRSIGPASAYAAVLVFALYISSANVTLLYRHPYLLWLVCPVMLYWLTRLWFLTNRSKPMDDPVLFALTDVASHVCGVVVLLLVFLAT